MYLTKVVELRIYDGNDNIANLYTNSNPEGDSMYGKSIQDYINSRLGKTTDKNEKALLLTIVAYGTYAQDYFRNVKGNQLVDATFLSSVLEPFGLSMPDISGITADMVNRVNNKGTNEAGVGFALKAFSVALDAAVDLTLKFEMASGYDLDDYSYVLTDVSGATKELVPSKESGRCVLVIKSIAAAYWDHEYTITVTNKVTGETNVWGTSVLALVTTKIKSTNAVEKEKNIVKAMYLYNLAADAYFTK